LQGEGDGFLEIREEKSALLTPSTIELKLSSSKSMSAAFLAISEPEPMAIPTSAFLIAAESLTPSPVTATT